MKMGKSQKIVMIVKLMEKESESKNARRWA